MPETHAASDADFIPQIASDWRKNKTVDVLIAIGASPMITAETALYLWRADPQTGPRDALQFLEFIVNHSRH